MLNLLIRRYSSEKIHVLLYPFAIRATMYPASSSLRVPELIQQTNQSSSKLDICLESSDNSYKKVLAEDLTKEKIEIIRSVECKNEALTL